MLGNVITAGALGDKVFVATKLEAPDAAEFKRSLARLKMGRHLRSATVVCLVEF